MVKYSMENVKSQMCIFVVIETYAKIFINSVKFENKPPEVIIDMDKV